MIVNGFKSKAAAIRHLRDKGFKIAGLLASPESNPKVAKNGKLGVLTAPLHLAPAKESGFEVCPMRSLGCTAACLHTAGNPAYMEGKRKSRIEKTRAYMLERAAFMAVLVFEIRALHVKANKLGVTPGIRLNATSDIPWERVRVNIDGSDLKCVMQAFPHVEFYDYTKITKRAIAWAEGRMPANYHLTFSKHESNDADVARVLDAGGNVSVVFRAKSLPERFNGFPVINGDEHDFRPADMRADPFTGKPGVVVGLKAKGDAKADTSGFVVDVQ